MHTYPNSIYILKMAEIEFEISPAELEVISLASTTHDIFVSISSLNLSQRPQREKSLKTLSSFTGGDL